MSESAAARKKRDDRLYYLRHGDQIRARVNAYRLDNSEAVRERKRAHYLANRDAIRARVKRYAAANREAVLARRKRHYEKNREYEIARNKAYAKRNPEIMHRGWTAGVQRRRARMRATFVEFIDIAVLFARDRETCGICRGPVLRREASIDHVFPLSRGGEHSYKNAQLAHLTCNQRKAARIIGLESANV